MRGASAIEKVLEAERGQNLRVFVVWEPVLPTDFAAPSTATLARLSDLRVSQYWDKDHLVSHLLGERDRKSVVWDYVAVYARGTLWDQTPPQPVYSGTPVVRAIGGATGAIRQLLGSVGSADVSGRVSVAADPLRRSSRGTAGAGIAKNRFFRYLEQDRGF